MEDNAVFHVVAVATDRQDSSAARILWDWRVVMLVMERNERQATVEAALTLIIFSAAIFLVYVAIAHTTSLTQK